MISQENRMSRLEYAIDRICQARQYTESPTKFGALQHCSMQEMLHAGQIGLLRRLLGMTPVR